MTHDLVLAAAVWAVLGLLAVVTLACMGRAAHDEDVRLGYDPAVPPVSPQLPRPVGRDRLTG